MSETLHSAQPDPVRKALADALWAILWEVDGKGVPYSTESWLPEHLIEAARKALDAYTRDEVQREQGRK